MATYDDATYDLVLEGLFHFMGVDFNHHTLQLSAKGQGLGAKHSIMFCFTVTFFMLSYSGLLQSLLVLRVPPPQDLEQTLYGPQGPHSPWTGCRSNSLFTHIPCLQYCMDIEIAPMLKTAYFHRLLCARPCRRIRAH